MQPARWRGSTRSGCPATIVREVPALVMPAHAHDEGSMSLVIEGALVEEACHQVYVASPGAVVWKPAGTVHANRFGPSGALLLRFDLAPHTLEFLEARGSHAGLSWRWSMAPHLAHIGRLAFAARETEAVGVILSELAGRMFALVSGNSQRANAPPSWLLEYREKIADLRTAGVRLVDLAKQTGYHPAYVTRRFRGEFGCSPREYRRRARLDYAVALLRRSRGTLASVAGASGFADQSHLCRAVRCTFGMQLRELQRLARGPGTMPRG